MEFKIIEKLKNNVDVILLVSVLILALTEKWVGMWSMLILFFGFMTWRIYKVWAIMKPFTNKGMVHEFGTMWEREQLGYDLDDPYWDDKKRPSIMQKIKGINPNMTDQENIDRHIMVAEVKAEQKAERKARKNSKKTKD